MRLLLVLYDNIYVVAVEPAAETPAVLPPPPPPASTEPSPSPEVLSEVVPVPEVVNNTAVTAPTPAAENVGPIGATGVFPTPAAGMWYDRQPVDMAQRSPSVKSLELTVIATCERCHGMSNSLLFSNNLCNIP